jgi:predicted ATPase
VERGQRVPAKDFVARRRQGGGAVSSSDHLGDPMKTLRKVKIEGFKSVERTELELGDLNVVIGANGSGKSNLISVFRLLERVLSGRLQEFVASQPDRLLYFGRKVTPALSLDFTFDQNSYGVKLRVAQDTLVVDYEGPFPNGLRTGGHKESLLKIVAERQLKQPGFPQAENAKEVLSWASNLVVYHFNDTSDSSPAKLTCNIDDNRFLRSNAANLPAYLYWLQEKYPVQFRHIEEHVRLVAPFFEGFVLEPLKLNGGIKLEWRHKGSDAYFDIWQLSDGTLRFICLATLLLQPEPPALILLDEPELGLHPFAIRILAEMLEAASQQAQVLLATQSVTLLDNFAPQNVIVAENDGMKTTFNRLDEEKLKVWLDEFSLGELWEKNVLGGQP